MIKRYWRCRMRDSLLCGSIFVQQIFSQKKRYDILTIWKLICRDICWYHSIFGVYNPETHSREREEPAVISKDEISGYS